MLADIQWIEVRVAIRYSTMCRILPETKNYLIENASSVKIEKPCVSQTFPKWFNGISVYEEKQLCGLKKLIL